MSGPGSTAARQFSVTTRAHVAVDDATGEPIGLDDVDVRVGWLLDLVAAAGCHSRDTNSAPALTARTAGCPRKVTSPRPVSAGLRSIRTGSTCRRG